MKKLIYTVIILFLSWIVKAEDLTIKVGATAVPHAEILEFVKPMLKKEGVDLQIVIFQDYILPNKALASKDLDANYFQHSLNLTSQIKENGYNLVSVASVHIEAMGLYSKRYKKVSDIPQKATVILSNSVADRGRALAILAKAGLIKLNPKINIANADISDIVSSPKQLEFKPFVDPAMLARLYLSDEADLYVINANYAMESGLNPKKDALIVENKASPYVNVLVTRPDMANTKQIKILIKALKSAEVHNFILQKYKGSVIPIK